MFANGNAIDIEFYFDTNASIILAPIPEPTTLLLLGLGAVVLKKRS